MGTHEQNFIQLTGLVGTQIKGRRLLLQTNNMVVSTYLFCMFSILKKSLYARECGSNGIPIFHCMHAA